MFQNALNMLFKREGRPVEGELANIKVVGHQPPAAD